MVSVRRRFLSRSRRLIRRLRRIQSGIVDAMRLIRPMKASGFNQSSRAGNVIHRRSASIVALASAPPLIMLINPGGTSTHHSSRSAYSQQGDIHVALITTYFQLRKLANIDSLVPGTHTLLIGYSTSILTIGRIAGTDTQPGDRSGYRASC